MALSFYACFFGYWILLCSFLRGYIFVLTLLDTAFFQFYRVFIGVLRRNSFAVVGRAIVIHPLEQLGFGIQRKRRTQSRSTHQQFRIDHHFTP
jgi:hypothetical protein